MFLIGEEVAQYQGAYKVIILRFTINTVYTPKLIYVLFTVCWCSDRILAVEKGHLA